MGKKKIVVVGGGTGTHTVLTGLKQYIDSCTISAIVAMTDSGGSTGRLRDEFGYLPVGDVRMALVALAREDTQGDSLLRKLFLHRFGSGGEFQGHNFGNLFLVALTDILGSEEKAIEAASSVLNVTGRVIPVTRTNVHLVATYDDGSTVQGEHDIDEPDRNMKLRHIVKLHTEPEASLTESAEEALRTADMIILGPGDLYTSILANCVIRGFKEALSTSSARLVYVANLMTKSGQTHGMSLGAHVREVTSYVGRAPDYTLVNTLPLPTDLLERYAAEGEYPVTLDVQDRGVSQIISAPLLSEEVVHTPAGDVLRRSLIRHDPKKLADTVIGLF